MLHSVLLLTCVCLAAATTDLRRTRQLDLGPATNQLSESTASRSSNFQQPGYLPPVEPAGAQDDPVVLAPTTPASGPTHHGRDLCTDPFHSFLCANLRPRRPITGALPNQRNIEPDGNALFGANTFLEPSKVLAPPINDLEDQSVTTTTTIAPTTFYRFPSTTTSTTTARPSTIITTRKTTTSELPIVPEPSNDDRTYLPPENIAPAAAQQDVAVLKPDTPEEHHHHPHHHGRDLCSDPFHSFLCTPLKPRKRITGNLPNNIQGQNSVLVPQKVRPVPEVSPQPSNEIDRAYLPPVITTKRPTTTTTTTRPFEPQPSNEIDSVYLPPSTLLPTPPPPTTTRRPPSPTTTSRRPSTVRFSPEASNEIDRLYLPPATSTRLPTTTTTTTTLAPIQPQPSNEVDRTYLPPAVPQPSNIDKNYLPPEPKIEPAAAQEDPAIATPDHDHHHGSHGFKDICSDPFHSFLCTVPKPRTRITGALPDRFRTNTVSPSPSNIDETRVRVLQHKTDSFRVVVIPRDTQTPQSSQQLVTKLSPPGSSSAENELTLPAENKQVTGYDYPKPASPLSEPTKGYSYPKPERKLTLPSEEKAQVVIAPTTPRVTSTTTVRYSSPTRDNKLTLPSENKPVIGYDYPKPTVGLPEPTKGYSYPKPDVKLTLPSENKPVIGYDYPKPTVGLPEPTKGYSYPKPNVKLTLPSENKPVIGYDYPKPTVGLPEPTKGYSYPKPEAKLTLPSENKLETGNKYFKSSTALPQAKKNYDYPQPENKLSIGTEARPLKKLESGYPTLNQNIQSSITNPSRNTLPSSLKEARERLAGSKVTQISNISSQNSVSDFIPVNQVEFPADGSVRFGDRLKRRERKSYLIPPAGSHRL